MTFPLNYFSSGRPFRVLVGVFFTLLCLVVAIVAADGRAALTQEVADGTAVAVAAPPEAVDTLLASDAATLRVWSEAAGVPYVHTWALAYEETRRNTSPGTRGGHGEWGRFQILPSTAKSRCGNLDTRTYYGNLACFLKMTREDALRCRGDYRCAARIHNGSGPKAEAYADRVWATTRALVEREVAR